MNSFSRKLATGVGVSLFVVSAFGVGPDEGDILVGRTAAGRLLALNAPDDLLTLPQTEGGWVGSEPGIDHVTANQPAEDVFVLETGCSIRLEVVSLDPALFVVQSGTLIVLDSPGDSFVLRPSGPSLHEHPLWFIDSEDGAFDPNWSVFHGTFRLTDSGSTGYTASEPFTLRFVHTAPLLGDMNCNGTLSVGDIAGFVLALTAPAAYVAANPDCDVVVGDMNGNGVVSVTDIAGFVDALTF